METITLLYQYQSEIFNHYNTEIEALFLKFGSLEFISFNGNNRKYSRVDSIKEVKNLIESNTQWIELRTNSMCLFIDSSLRFN
jgi:hypothetical protein